MNPSTLY